MTGIADDRRQSMDYAYNALSRLTRTSYADHDGSADTVDQYYDKTGSVTQRIDQRNISTIYMYDSLHRLTKKQDDPSSATIVETYEHDGLSRMTLAMLTKSGTELSDVRYYRISGISGDMDIRDIRGHNTYLLAAGATARGPRHRGRAPLTAPHAG